MDTSDLPAILGGEPIRPEGPPDWPPRDEAVREAMLRAWAEGSWGKYDGGNVGQLVERMRAWTGQAHVVTCASGTLAVEVALRALGVSDGEVVLAAYDYPGNFLAVHAVGARPVLVDVQAGDWQISVEGLAEVLRGEVRAVIVSHLHGGLVPMRAVMELAGARGVPVIEDAAQVPGARVQGRLAGTWGDVGIYSFGGSKLLSAGRGGALTTGRAEVAQRARLILGRGTNLVAPLSEMQAVVLLPQLDRLEERNARRASAVERLRRDLAAVPGVRLFRSEVEGSAAYYKLGMHYDAEAFGVPRGQLAQAMRAEGIALDEGFRALHVGRSGSRWRSAGPLAEADRAHGGCLVLHHPVLLGEEREQREIVAALERIRRHLGRK